MQAELGKPGIVQPDKGKVFIYIDCSSTAEPAFEVAYFVACHPSLYLSEVIQLFWFTSYYTSILNRAEN